MPQFEPLLKKAIAAACDDADLLTLIADAPLPSLGDGPRCPPLLQWLSGNRRAMPPAAEAGLWLLAGDLNASHDISQQGGSPEADLWHAVMHRREGDYWNAKYWFRRAARHPVLQALAAGDYGAAEHFVDRCQQAVEGGQAAADGVLQQAQWSEWQHLWLASWLAE